METTDDTPKRRSPRNNDESLISYFSSAKQRTLLLHVDPDKRRGPPNIESPLPLPPPIRPTIPFAYPQWPDTAHFLGGNCPPVEEIWDGYGSEVTDPCTLEAVATAVDWMWTGDASFRQRAVRDGQAMAPFFQHIDSIEDPYLKAILGHDSRINGLAYIREGGTSWAGHFPGASIIHVEWNLFYAQRASTPEEQEAKDRNYRELEGIGVTIPDRYWGDGVTLGDIGWSWYRALIVRTADGTWRMSYRAVCHWYQGVNLAKRLLCPDDPNPHFLDSVWFDSDIYPPSHKNYYQDSSDLSAIHQDKLSHRRSPE